MKTVVLIINMGTPDSPKTKDVGRYLREFLNDYRVMNIPWVFRKLLVNLIIVPFRANKSAKKYQSIWTAEGSPLMVNSKKLSIALSKNLPDQFRVESVMRYGNPGLEESLQQLERVKPEQIVLLPLFPQYASSTTGSTLETALRLISGWKYIPDVKMIHHFHNHSGFIDAFTQRILMYEPQSYDHILMSYHGLPMNHILDSHPEADCNMAGCRVQRNNRNFHCYLASCFETSRLLAANLGLTREDYSVSFQSRMMGNWTGPFTDEVARNLVKKGKMRVLVVR